MPKIKTTTLYSLFVPLLIFGLAAAFPGCKEPPRETVELEVWGVFDDSDVYDSLIEEFNVLYPETKIRYYKKTYANYEQDFLEAMATGRGPDIFVIHNTWLPRYIHMLQVLSFGNGLLTLKDFKESFVDVVYDDFATENGEIAALPLSVDTLALYYNKNIFNTNGIPQPPRTWEKFLEDVEKLVIKDERYDVSQAGAALGTARNVNRSTDILSLLMLQSGTQMTDRQSNKAVFDYSIRYQGENISPGERSLQFYVDFANPLKAIYTWNTSMHYSIDAFSEGNLAMMFNYAYQMPVIRAKSPYLNFDIAPMPQIKDAAQDVNYANYWGLTVAANSQYPERAWEFIVWLTDRDAAQKYLEITDRPTARRDLVDWQKSDVDMGIFAEQALSAQSWYQVDNFSIEQIFADMIESVVLGEATVSDAIGKAADQVTLLMQEQP